MSQTPDWSDYLTVFVHSHGDYNLLEPTHENTEGTLGYQRPQWDARGNVGWVKHGVYSAQDWFTAIPGNMVIIDPIPVSFLCGARAEIDIVVPYVICKIGLETFMTSTRDELRISVANVLKNLNAEDWHRFLLSRNKNVEETIFIEFKTYIDRNHLAFINRVLDYKDNLVFSYSGKGERLGIGGVDYGNIALNFANDSPNNWQYEQYHENFSDIRICDPGGSGFAIQPPILKELMNDLHAIGSESKPQDSPNILLSSLLILLQHYQTNNSRGRTGSEDNPFFRKKLAIILISCRPPPSESLYHRNLEIKRLYDKLYPCVRTEKVLDVKEASVCLGWHERIMKLFADTNYFYKSFSYIYDLGEIKRLEEQGDTTAKGTRAQQSIKMRSDSSSADMDDQYGYSRGMEEDYINLFKQENKTPPTISRSLTHYIYPGALFSNILKGLGAIQNQVKNKLSRVYGGGRKRPKKKKRNKSTKKKNMNKKPSKRRVSKVRKSRKR